MRGVLYDGGPNALWVFLFVTIALGGAAAWASGRAIAQTWRTFGRLPIAMVALSLVVCFLHYALFDEAAISLTRLAASLARLRTDGLPALAEVAAVLRYWASNFVILTGFAAAGFRLTRARQMQRQYPWMIHPK